MSTLKRYNGTNWETIGGSITGDTLPIGSEIDYTGSSVPAGWEEVADYSTSEINTGKTWIDGKPIYRKVIEYTKPDHKTSTAIPHNISNLGTIVNVYGWSYVEDTWRSITNFYSSDISTYNQCLYQIDGTNILMVYSSWYGNKAYQIIFVLEYTKTTD